jgi:hypothetical protein
MEKANRDLDSEEYNALTLLEESRIEYQGLLAKPRSANFLRASAMDLVVADSAESFSTMPDLQKAISMVALVSTRVDAGIIDPEDAVELTELLEDYLTTDTVRQLLDIAEKFREHDDHANADPVLYDLAREWVAVSKDKAEEMGESASEGQGDDFSEFAGALQDAMEEVAQAVAVSVQSDLGDQEQKEDWQEQVETKASEAKEGQINAETSKRVFSRSSGGTGSSSTRLRERRAPRVEERQASVTIAKWLEKAKYRDRDVTEIASSLPPGRLRTRAIVQGKALEARGVHQPVQPWRKKVRKMTDDPTLTVGVMVDISGSMYSAMEPMATTAWVMSEAVRRVQGRTAMVYYGNEVFPTLKPGQHLDQVNVWEANDGYEKFDEAFRALDGALNLLNGTGARLLVVTSDGAYRSKEAERAIHWVTRCKQAGVAVLWLPFDNGMYAQGVERAGARVLSGVLDPSASALEIGKEASRVLTEAGS